MGNGKYCYKVKHAYIKTNPNNAYKKAKIESFGYEPMLEEETGDWVHGWAKSLTLPATCKIAEGIRKMVRDIYEKDPEWYRNATGEDYKEVIEDIHAQICIVNGILYINAGGQVEYFDTRVLDEHIGSEIKTLLDAGVIYKKKIN